MIINKLILQSFKCLLSHFTKTSWNSEFEPFRLKMTETVNQYSNRWWWIYGFLTELLSSQVQTFNEGQTNHWTASGPFKPFDFFSLKFTPITQTNVFIIDRSGRFFSRLTDRSFSLWKAHRDLLNRSWQTSSPKTAADRHSTEAGTDFGHFYKKNDKNKLIKSSQFLLINWPINRLTLSAQISNSFQQQQQNRTESDLQTETFSFIPAVKQQTGSAVNSTDVYRSSQTTWKRDDRLSSLTVLLQEHRTEPPTCCQAANKP